MVIWLMGISGAGKTTLGNLLKKQYETAGKKCFLIDGDTVRNFFDNDLGYSVKEREENIKRIILAAYVLESTGITVIVCNISPFQKLRDFARRKFNRYVEIYLKKSLDKAIAADVKCLYKENINKTALVGRDIKFEEPTFSDITIDVDSESVEESFSKLITFCVE